MAGFRPVGSAPIASAPTGGGAAIASATGSASGVGTAAAVGFPSDIVFVGSDALAPSVTGTRDFTNLVDSSGATPTVEPNDVIVVAIAYSVAGGATPSCDGFKTISS